MADVTVSRQHSLTREAAQAKVREMAESFAQKHGLTLSHTDTGMNVTGGGVHGGIVVTETCVTVEMSLPLYAKPLKGMVEQGLREALDKHLA